uniref:Gypsy retrotransposon integrase-like protein 1 n=1 Tax=Latimeria chalumnae TaxID=7897 RepID=H3AP44_LATCH
SQSPYASPIVVAHKKDGSLWVCIYQQLNSKTVRDAFPLPRIEEALDDPGKAKYCSTLDLTSGYWQVEMAEQDKPNTSFTTPMDLFKCNQMPFGLQNAPATFQRLMTCCLGDLNFVVLFIYLDDVIVFSSTFEEHLEHLKMVFDRLHTHGLKLKPKKCHLLQEKVKYLGHVVSANGIAMDPEKIQRVRDWKTPTNCKEVSQFLGFAGYCRQFMKNYSKLAALLFCLMAGSPKRGKGMRKKVAKPPPFFWTDECSQAFSTIKNKLTTAPVLGYADYSLPFILQTDASTEGLGAILAQVQSGVERVIAYASRSLSHTEKRYPAHKLMFLALKWAVADYLLERHFTMLTDNNPLVYRWIAKLAEFNFEVKYCPGKNNANADGLSRMPLEEVSDVLKQGKAATTDEPRRSPRGPKLQGWGAEVFPRLPKEEGNRAPSTHKKRQEDPLVHCLLRQWDKLIMEDGILYRKIRNSEGEVVKQMVLPDCLQKEAFLMLHTDMGHGVDRTVEFIQARFYWANMYSVIKGWCDAYERCCLHKIPAPHTITLTSVHTVRPLELVCLDFLTLERSKGGIENVLVVTDYYTRYAQAYPTPDQRAPTIANVLWKRFICHYGIPERIHTDQGMNFESNLLQQLWKVMGISKSWTTPYHPQGNGTTERFNRTLMNMLGTLEPDQKLNRKEYVEPMTHAYNCTRHESTGFSPFLLMSGRHPRLPVDLALGLPHMEEGVSEYEDYVQQFQDRLAKAYKRATDLSTKAKQKQKYFYDCKAREAPLALGDWVLVANKGQRGKQKLRDKWERAPHVVIKKQGELPVYVVCPETGAGERVLHRNLLT